MAKIKLGNAPKNFKRTVTFPLLDGTEGQIECVFKYRTRTQFGALVDSLSKDAGEPLKNGQFSMETIMEKTRDKNGEYLIEVLDGWDVDAELNIINAQQLADEVPSAVMAIMDAYRLGINEGRLGN